MEEQRPAQPGQVQIKADEKELQGSYSNLVMIHHNLEEFTLNFIYIFPNGSQGKLLQSMIVNPGHAKRIWRGMRRNSARSRSRPRAVRRRTWDLCNRDYTGLFQGVARHPDVCHISGRLRLIW